MLLLLRRSSGVAVAHCQVPDEVIPPIAPVYWISILTFRISSPTPFHLSNLLSWHLAQVAATYPPAR